MVTDSGFTYKARFKNKLLYLLCGNTCSPDKSRDRSLGINSSELLGMHTLCWKCHYNAYNFNKIIDNHCEVLGFFWFSFFSNWNNCQRFQLSALCLGCFILFISGSMRWKWNSFTKLVTTLAEIKERGSSIGTEGISLAVKIVLEKEGKAVK